MTFSTISSLFLAMSLSSASLARADHIEFLSKPYPRIELFPENIMKPYDDHDFPWIESPQQKLPSNFQYILKPFYLQSIHWLC